MAGTDVGKTYSTTDDYDGDGKADNFDNCPFVFNPTQTDSDGDGVGDACDNCPHTANNQSDINGNGIGDACDPDEDGDGIFDKINPPNGPNGTYDNCPTVPNPNQAVFAGGTPGLGELCDKAYLNSAAAAGTDTDKDTIPDSTDNCPAMWNPEQTITDKNLSTNPNKLGDACNPDIDGDGVANAVDNCPTMYNPPTAPPGGLPIQNDGDHNGYGDNYDVSGNVIASFSNAPDRNGQTNGVALCNPSGFCFVAADNKAAPCLDPQDAFHVTATPNVQSAVGDPVYLNLLANRASTAIKYSWAVTSSPGGANTTVSNPIGTVSQSAGWEYTYGSARPTFTPSHPGTYVVTLAADLVSPDALFPTGLHAESTVNLEISGAAKSGCKQSDATALAMLASLGLVGAGIVRRRRR